MFLYRDVLYVCYVVSCGLVFVFCECIRGVFYVVYGILKKMVVLMGIVMLNDEE